MSTRLFFGHLARGTSQRHLESFISDFGDVREVAVVDRFGFVDFRNPRDAADAVRELNGKNFRGERVIVEYARSRGGQRERRDVRRGPPARSKYRIIVENVSSRATWKDLKDHMRRAGEVCFADVHRERSGEGIVEYDRHDDFKYAFTKLQDSEFFGKKIFLVDDYRSSRRGRSGSRSPRPERNRSPRRGRSRSFSPRRERNHSRSPRRERDDSRRESRRSRSPQRNPRRSDSRSLSPKRQSTRSRRSISRSQSPKAYRSGSHSPEHGDSSHVTGFKNDSGESPKNSEGECTPPPPHNDSVSPDDSVQPNGIDSQIHDDSVAVDMA